MGYGVIGKVFLEFDDTFWPINEQGWVAYGFLWTKTDMKELIGTKREWLVNSFIFLMFYFNYILTGCWMFKHLPNSMHFQTF